MATSRSRHAARLRADRRRAQARARWFALAVVVGVLGIITLALTAFDSNSRSGAAPDVAPLPVKSAPPEPQVLATVGNLRVQSPVAQGGGTAVGFHDSGDGALVLQPVGPQANEGLLARLWRRITGAFGRGRFDEGDLLPARQHVPVDGCDLLIFQGDAVEAHVVQPGVERGSRGVGRSAEIELVAPGIITVEQRLQVHSQIRGLAHARSPST